MGFKRTGRSNGTGRKAALRASLPRKGGEAAPRTSLYDEVTSKIILHVLYAETDKTLSGVANFISNPNCPLDTVINTMLTTPPLNPSCRPIVLYGLKPLSPAVWTGCRAKQIAANGISRFATKRLRYLCSFG